MSPELLDPERFGIPQSEGDRPTRQSDCYALGMVIYEVCSCEYICDWVQLTDDTLGLMRTPSLPRDPIRSSSHPRDHGGGSAGETGGSETPRVQQRTVEDC
jgi:hypothetical protein